MGIIAAGQITVVDLSDAPVLNTFITASRPTTQTYSKDAGTYNPSYASTPQVLTLKLTKAGSTANIIDSISSLHWFVVDGPIKTEITSKDNTANEYISGAHNEILTTKLDIDINKGSKRYEVMGIWPDPSTGLDVQFGGYIDLLLTQNGATGPQGPQGDTGNGIANTVITYGLSMSDTTEPATWSSEMPTLVKGMYLWTRTVIIYTNGGSTTSYQISYIAKDADATAEIDKAKQELLEKLETVRDESLEAVDEAKQQLVTVRDESLAAAEEAKQGLANVASELNTAKQDLADSVTAVNTKVDSAKEELTQAKQQLTTVSDDLSKAKTDFQNAVSAVDTKATNLKSDLAQAKQDLASQAQQLQEQASAQSELTNRVSSVEETANGTKTTVRELSKTVAQNGKDITSVTARTKVVEDDLSGTKTTLSQVKTTADSTSQKTATLETGLNGLNAKFDNLKIGGRNLLSKTNQGKTNWAWKVSSGETTAEDYNVDGVNAVKLTRTSDVSFRWDYIQYKGLLRKLIEPNTKYTLSFDVKPSVDVTFSASLQRGDGGAPLTNAASMNKATANQWTKVSCVLTSNTTLPDDLSQVVYLSGMPVAKGNWLIIKNIKLEKGNVATDYSPSDADVEQKIAEYKQNADQNYASLQTTVQNLDGTVQHNKTVAEQTAQGFKTRIESLETYKDGESTRANQYFESAKTETAKQLTAERTAIANNYVAKSTYTSDVTGIRNELSATTSTANATKTNLANYQASNDKMVASLKSSLQTTDGNVSNLQTKVEAVPGQITSAVSAVEGKIPTSVGARNYIRNYGLTATGWTSHKSGWKFEIISDSTAKSGQYLKATCTTASTSSVSGFYKNLFDFSDGRFFGKQMTWSMDIKTSKNTKLNIGCEWGNAQSNVNVTENWQRFSKTFKVATSSNQKAWIFYSSNWNVGDIVYIRDVQLEDGSIATSPVPAIEDTESDISALSSEIKQTADGITLLATKTELNNAKTELQSGINTATNKANNNAQTISTHTTQISALNTGLQAKVSQTDFNTLSGRVTTAENNITAKANELSSKITSVEGKIPTNVSTRNLILKSNDFAKPHKQGGANTEVTSTNDYFVVKSTGYTANAYGGMSWNMSISEVKAGEEFSILMPVYIDSSINLDGAFNFELKQHNPSTTAYAYNIPTNKKDQWFNISITFKAVKDVVFGTYPFYVYLVKNGLVRIKPPMLVRGNLIPSDYQPAFEDTESDITKLSSELTQTKDGITLLATKTELNNAKTELQSGINTATNKANNNAQTISAHTTQISALNTGLQAKVSQTDFNTLSGRVTTAENNITAKANELSSKITSVEGKIPTTAGGRNYIRDYGLTATGWGNTNSAWKFEIISDSTAKSGQYLKATCTTASTSSVSGFYKNLFDFSDGRFFGKQMTWSMDVKLSKAKSVKIGPEWGRAYLDTNATTDWKRYSKTFTVAKTTEYNSWIFYTNDNVWNVGDIVYIRDVQLEDGSIVTSPVPAIEDTESDITKLSSELTQTKDGITLLATKTELNTAKNELQSGINTATNKANNNAQTISTHTTQISALNTGLQAKVSQSEFNTLSGRVTTAENNITAKANELSSKITSVEGKIPTNVSTRNLILKSNDFANPHKQNGNNTTVTSTNDYFVIKSTGYTANAWGGMSWNMSISKVKAGEEFSILMPVYIDSSVNLDSGFSFDIKNHPSNISAYGYSIPTNKKDQWFNVAITFKANKDVVFDTYPFYVYIVKNGLVRIKPPMLVRGNLIPSDWQPAPEDTISQISSLSSELKQTKDGITLLATKTELNTAKSELQSGINTATNKANSAQNTANNNAQTISAHTTQISALNTGLQAKVSQSDFNTLSGRVTTAENNITAKANELSSKITSVEGKLPTSVSHRNLVQGTSSSWSPFVNISTNTNWCYDLATIKYGDSTGIRDGTTINIFVYLSADELTLGGPSPRIFIQGMVIDKNGNLTWTNWDKYHPFKSKWSSNLVSGNNYRIVKLSSKVTSESFSNINGFQIGIRIDGVQSGKFHHRALMVTTGDIFPDSWSPAPEDAINQINSVSSEFKQTTDAIKASVTSLDKSTVKSSSLTINSDGIVMKAGKSTTDVANAIGSYFAVNQNAIDLFADKIKVKGNMIVNGTITGDKIKASSVDVSKIVGIDANFIKSKIEYAMIDWLKGKTITAYNDNMTIDLQNGRISFKDGSNAVYRQTSDGIHTGFLHFEAGSQGGVYAAFGTTSTRQGINSKSSEFAGIRCYRVSANGDSHAAKIDKIEVIGDTVQFGHTYHPNGTIGGGFIMQTAAYYDDPPYSLNRMVSSIESLWRILYVHGKNVGYNLSHPNFINALRDEYNAWHDMHNR